MKIDELSLAVPFLCLISIQERTNKLKLYFIFHTHTKST